MKLRLLMASALVCTVVLVSSASAREPGWSNQLILQGPARNAGILHRPYRPFHFFGNTVRRIHYRGTILPDQRDFVQRRTSTRYGR